MHPATLMYWRIGIASKNSLPTISNGSCGSSPMLVCQPNGPRPSSVAACTRRSFSLVSIRLNVAEAHNAGSSLESVRTMSLASVPRPGPISAIAQACRLVQRPPGAGQPHGHKLAKHLADLWRRYEIARAPKWIARRVVAMRGIGQAEREVIRNADRPARCDQRGDALAERRHAVRGAAAGRAVAIAHTPASTIGTDRTMPMVNQPPDR